MRAGGWDWAPSRRSPGTIQHHFAETNSKPRERLENAHAVPTGSTLRSHHNSPGARRRERSGWLRPGVHRPGVRCRGVAGVHVEDPPRRGCVGTLLTLRLDCHFNSTSNTAEFSPVFYFHLVEQNTNPSAAVNSSRN